MTKRQLIDEITSINRTAQPGFLARFDEMDLDEYLRHLRHARSSRLSGDASRYSKYFAVGCAAGSQVKEPIIVPVRPQPVPVAAAATDKPSREPAVQPGGDSRASLNAPSAAFRQMASALPPAHRTLPSDSAMAAGSSSSNNSQAAWLF